MWSTLLRFVVPAMAGWIMGDVVTTHQQAAGTQTVTQSIGQALRSMKNWIKWLVIGVGTALIVWLVAIIIKKITKRDILKS